MIKQIQDESDTRKNLYLDKEGDFFESVYSAQRIFNALKNSSSTLLLNSEMF